MKHLLLFVCVLFFTFSGCTKQKFDKILTTQPVLDKDATLSWQDCAFFARQNLTVCFVDVEESRCPCGATCFTAGAVNAILHLTSVTAGLDSTIVLTSNSDADILGETKVQGKTIRFSKIIAPTSDTCEGYGETDKYKIVVTVE